MSYFQPPKERPRHVKRFLTVRDIEDAAAGGCREIIHVDDLVITDAAREIAHDLGVAIIKPDPDKEAAANKPAVSAPMPAPQTSPAGVISPSHETAPPVPFAPASSAYAPSPNAYKAPGLGGMPAPAFAPPPHAHPDGHPLVQELAHLIRARWKPVKRRQRQLLT